MRMSVIVPVYGQLPLLMQCMQSLTQTADGTRTEIILADDASPEFDLTTLPMRPARCIRNAQNSGFSATCNAGAAQAGGDVLLFLNSDTVAHAGWQEPLFAALENPAVGIVGPKLLFPNDKAKYGDAAGTIQSAGGLFDAGLGPFHRYLGYAATDRRVNVPEKVSWTTGAALAIRAELFRKIGGFNPAYGRGYFEDVELCVAAQLAGGEVWYEPRSVFTHAVGASTSGNAPDAEKAKSFMRNSRLFHKRWDDVLTPDVQQVMVGY